MSSSCFAGQACFLYVFLVWTFWLCCCATSTLWWYSCLTFCDGSLTKCSLIIMGLSPWSYSSHHVCSCLVPIFERATGNVFIKHGPGGHLNPKYLSDTFHTPHLVHKLSALFLSVNWPLGVFFVHYISSCTLKIYHTVKRFREVGWTTMENTLGCKPSCAL